MSGVLDSNGDLQIGEEWFVSTVHDGCEGGEQGVQIDEGYEEVGARSSSSRERCEGEGCDSDEVRDGEEEEEDGSA